MPKKLHNALTAIAVKNLGPGRHADGGGLYLRVQGSGARSWLFRAMVDGKAKDIGLGPAIGARAVSLSDARAKAKELAALYAKGEAVESDRERKRRVDAEIRKAALIARPFREYAEAFVDRMEREWKNPKHRQQWRNTLATYAYPVIGDLPVAEVTTAHVMAVLEPIWSTKQETADRLRGRLEAILAAAKVESLRTGENPAAWRGHLDHLLPKRAKGDAKNHPALAYSQLPLFLEELRKRKALAALALEFTILTAARSDEVRKATWKEVDLQNALWTVPAERMKKNREHEVPLSNRAMAILRDTVLLTNGHPDALLFPGPKGKDFSENAMRNVIVRMHETRLADGLHGWIDPKQGGRMITAHGFRSTFRDWAGEKTSFPREVIEHSLAHQLGDKAERAYARATLLPKRIQLMRAWADYCTAPRKL